MSSLPRSGSNPQGHYTVDGRPVPEAAEEQWAQLQSVNAGYFATLGVPLVQGRLLDDSDREDAAEVAVVSEALVARALATEDPIGRTLTVEGESRQIVGVVGNIRQRLARVGGQAGEMIYLPVEQFARRDLSFALRTVREPTALAGDVRQAIWSVEPDQPVAQVRTLEAHIDESLAGPKAISLSIMVLGGIALGLAAMGIYGVMAHSVTQQQREIGIRLALGAGHGKVVRMITRSGLVLVAAGLVLGLPLVFLIFRGTASALDLFNVEPSFTYPIVLGFALMGVAVVATVGPARRASRIAPVAALKE